MLTRRKLALCVALPPVIIILDNAQLTLTAMRMNDAVLDIARCLDDFYWELHVSIKITLL